MAPEDELRQMLYDGEELVGGTAVGSGRIAVTSHRVLALDPDGDGPRFHAVDRPNVRDVGVRSAGEPRHGMRALRYGTYAAVLFGAGSAIDLGGMVNSIEEPSGTGLGGIVALIDLLVRVLGLIDDALLGLGAIALAVALAFGARYLASRERFLEIEVSGGDPIRVPVERGESVPAERIEAAIDAR